ncbi:MAG: HEPN domain-containing protein [Tannerellaceae bacterium]|jgi:uncharacterized protein (UPF0332 family)|nr:HEPN domain-containing protein [Tannerellaceae bacterium]
MRDKMDEKSRLTLVQYRLKRAKETLDEADIMIANERYNAAINRLYYACFYAAQALLAAHSIEAATHKGTKQMLGLHFFLAERLDVHHGLLYGQLFNARTSSDYEDFMSFTSESLALFRPAAEEFILAVEAIL